MCTIIENMERIRELADQIKKSKDAQEFDIAAAIEQANNRQPRERDEYDEGELKRNGIYTESELRDYLDYRNRVEDFKADQGAIK